MLNVSQFVLNQVAKEPTLEFKITKHLFSQPEDLIDQTLEDLVLKFLPLFQEQKPDFPASSLTMWFLEILPLYLDSRAIQNYIRRKEDYFVFHLLPEILSPEEAVEIISREITLSDIDKAILLLAFTNSKNNFPRIR